MKVLGAIKEVNEYDMVISLPNGLSGFLHITHINEKITEKLKEGLEVGETKDSEVRHNCNVVGFITYDSLCCQYLLPTALCNCSDSFVEKFDRT